MAAPGPSVGVDTVSVSAELADVLPASLAHEYGVIPLHLDTTTLTVAAETLADDAADTLGFLVDRRVEWVPAPRDALLRAKALVGENRIAEARALFAAMRAGDIA